MGEGPVSSKRRAPKVLGKLEQGSGSGEWAGAPFPGESGVHTDAAKHVRITVVVVVGSQGSLSDDYVHPIKNNMLKESHIHGRGG